MWPLKHDFLTVKRIFKHLEDPRKNKKAFCLLSSFPTWLKQDQGITCPKTKTKKESSSVTSNSLHKTVICGMSTNEYSLDKLHVRAFNFPFF